MNDTEPTREFVAKLEAENAELKQRVQQLAERERHLRAILDSEPECVKSLAADGTLLEMNRAGLEMIEAGSSEQVIGRCIYPLVVAEHRGAFQALTERVFRGQPGTLEFEVVGLKEGRRWLEMHATPFRGESGNIDSLLSVTRDITDRKRGEHALHESQTRLQMAVQATGLGPWDWDIVADRVYFSPEWKRQIGYEDHEIEGRYAEWESRLHPDDLAPTLQALRGYVAGEQSEYAVEFRLRHKDGSWRWIMTRANLIRDPDGRPIRMLGCHLDVTDRKRAEELITQQLTELQRWYDATLGREDRVRELKREVNQLLNDLGRPEQYPSQSKRLAIS